MTLYLAIEAGGTTSRAGLYDAEGGLLRETSGGPANPLSCGLYVAIGTLAQLAREIIDQEDGVLTIAAAVSGAARTELRQRMADGLAAALNARRVVVSDDLRPLLFANAGTLPAMLAIAGTGASVLCQTEADNFVLGARGVLFGDDGSGYAIAVRALRSAAWAVDGIGLDTSLTHRLPQALGLKDLAGVVPWSHHAKKHEVARLSVAVHEAALDGDEVAREIIKGEARALAALVESGAERIAKPGGVSLYLNGGLFEKSELYLNEFKRCLKETAAVREILIPPLMGHRAVLAMAMADSLPPRLQAAVSRLENLAPSLPPTEQRHEREAIDRLTSFELVRRMNEEDATVAAAVAPSAMMISSVIDRAGDALRGGGRLIYLGAGTSGRLGVLDASECPPTFGVPPDKVVALMAGGDRALRESVEGAEDDENAAKADVNRIRVSGKDVVVGIAASGTTPYVLGGLRAAAANGAYTVLLCCNPSAHAKADVVIALDTGPEALAGSTRLKAGTATKMALNMISTGAMARAGRIHDGLMVNMRPSNAKLHKRAVRMVATLTGLDEPAALDALESAEGNIAAAVIMTKKNLSVSDANKLLDESGGSLRAALEI